MGHGAARRGPGPHQDAGEQRVVAHLLQHAGLHRAPLPEQLQNRGAPVGDAQRPLHAQVGVARRVAQQLDLGRRFDQAQPLHQR